MPRWVLGLGIGAGLLALMSLASIGLLAAVVAGEALLGNDEVEAPSDPPPPKRYRGKREGP